MPQVVKQATHHSPQQFESCQPSALSYQQAATVLLSGAKQLCSSFPASGQKATAEILRYAQADSKGAWHLTPDT
jgi:hypothetical protein